MSLRLKFLTLVVSVNCSSDMDASLPLPPKSDWNSKYFGKEILGMKLFGLSLSGNEGTAYKMYSLMVLVLTVFLYPILDFFEYFKHDFSEVADMVVPQLASTLTMCKVAVLLRNRGSFVNLLAKLEQEPFLPNPKRGGEREQEMIDECVWITKIQKYTYWITAGITLFGTIIYTFPKRLRSSDYHDWQFPYGPFTLLNVTYSPNYEISFFYQSISITVFACHFTSVDLLLAAVLAHISYQFKILQNHIRRVVERSYEEMIEATSEFELKSARCLNSSTEIDVSAIPWRYLKNSLKKAIEYHLAIVDLASEVEQIFSELFLIVFLGTLALICFSIYATTAVGNNPQSAARHMGEGICACLQVVMVCFWGEQVRHESQAVGTAVWESKFVGTDVRFQKMLVLIIRRNQNPSKVTAGKFAEICLATFVWVMRTSYSSFMILQRVNADSI